MLMIFSFFYSFARRTRDGDEVVWCDGFGEGSRGSFIFEHGRDRAVSSAPAELDVGVVVWREAVEIVEAFLFSVYTKVLSSDLRPLLLVKTRIRFRKRTPETPLGGNSFLHCERIEASTQPHLKSSSSPSTSHTPPDTYSPSP